jgi:uncharacterized protein (TIGR03437 family)
MSSWSFRILFLCSLSTVLPAAQPLRFEPNLGQAPGDVLAVARGNSYSILVGGREMALALNLPAAYHASVFVRMRLLGAAQAPKLERMDALPGRSHYLLGSDASRWVRDVPQYGKVALRGIYDGVDLVYYGAEGRLEFDFALRPGVDPGVIRVAFDGARSMHINPQGDLILDTPGGELRQRQPAVYQVSNGKRTPVRARYFLRGNNEVGFELAVYDRRREVVIDPVFDYSTYLGGGADEGATAIAVDAAGNTYITGETQSTNFPVSGPFQATRRSERDAFVAKLNPAGTSLVYTTYLGGTGDDRGNGIAVDSAGNAYVAGTTASTNFPTQSPLRGTYGGGSSDAFVAKLDPAGSALVYSTYLGGSARDAGNAIALDGSGAAYVAGDTESDNFPTQAPLQGARGSGTCRNDFFGWVFTNPCADAFVSKLNPAGSALVYSTYVGGAKTAPDQSGVDRAWGIAVDSAGAAYITGETSSERFPTQGPVQAAFGGNVDAFVAKLNAAGSALVYSTYLGGSGLDYGLGIAAGGSGNAFVTGHTTSLNFPAVDALQAVSGGRDDAFVTQVSAAGSSWVYSTYLGGSADDQANAIAVDASGGAVVTGFTVSDNFPRMNAPQPLRGGSTDGFVSRLAPAGNALTISTYFGGAAGDTGQALALSGSGVVIAGGTSSNDLFVSAGAVQLARAGGSDAFVAKISDLAPSGLTFTPVSAASLNGAAFAPDSIVSAFGSGFAAGVTVADSPAPTQLGGVSVKVTDSGGTERLAQIFFVSAGQVNFLIPADTATGIAAVSITDAGGSVFQARARIENVAPGLFSANADGRGVAAAQTVRARANGERSTDLVFRYDDAQQRRVAVPIDLRPDGDQVVLLLYGTGLRRRSDLSAVKAQIGAIQCEVQFAGAQPEFAGLDQVNILLPRTLVGADQATVTLTVDGKVANPVTVYLGGRPRISSVIPSGLALGASGEVVIQGDYLTGVTQLLFEPAAGITVADVRSTETEVRAQVTVGDAAAIGDRPLRLVAPSGRSDQFKFLVRPKPGSKVPFIYGVSADSPLPISTSQVAVRGSLNFEDEDGDIVWTGRADSSAKIRLAGPGCTIEASGSFLDFAGKTSGRVSFVVAWSASKLSLIISGSATVRLLDAAGHQSNGYDYNPGIWWC